MTNNTTTQAQPRARIRQLKLGDTARAELEAHRDALHARMEQLHDELDEVERQYKSVASIVGWKIDMAFGTRVPTPPAKPTTTPATAPANPSARAAGYPKRDPNPNESTMLALDAAGRAGITSRELMGVTQVPRGTAGARLSVLKKEGKVVHVGNRYYLPHFMPAGATPLPMNTHPRVSRPHTQVQVVHSTQEDNNTTQGGEGIANHG